MPRGTARTLLLALDAVPYRVVRRACAEGVFAGWAPPRPVVAPFPTLTHVAFASLFAPFGVAPSPGYEVRHFDSAANRTVGGNPLTYRGDVPPWARVLDVPHRGVAAKVVDYVSSPRAALAELGAVADLVLGSSLDTVVAYVGATDGCMHLYADDALVELLAAVDARIRALRGRHFHERGTRLRVVLFSDHGCGRAPVHYTGDLRRVLRSAGLRPVEHLERPGDVVAPTFGIVNYAALFLAAPGDAAVAAEALAGHESVELAAYAAGPDTVTVVGGGGLATLLRHAGDHEPRYAYHPEQGDVLELDSVVQRLTARGGLDEDGFATGVDWLQESEFARYPDPVRRLLDALTGDRVDSRAHVLASLGPGWSWGWRSAFAGGLVRGGRLKGTHGGLDRESSLGFLLDSDPLTGGGVGSVAAADALEPYAGLVAARSGGTAER